MSERRRNNSSRRFAKVNRAVCVACGTCASLCPKQAASIKNGCWAEIDTAICVGCGLCAKACPADCIALAERAVAG